MENEISSARDIAEKIIGNVEKVIVGKREVIELAVIALMSQGHLLMEAHLRRSESRNRKWKKKGQARFRLDGGRRYARN